MRQQTFLHFFFAQTHVRDMRRGTRRLNGGRRILSYAVFPSSPSQRQQSSFAISFSGLHDQAMPTGFSDCMKPSTPDLPRLLVALTAALVQPWGRLTSPSRCLIRALAGRATRASLTQTSSMKSLAVIRRTSCGCGPDATQQLYAEY